MTLRINETLRHAMLTALAAAVDGGSGQGMIEIRSGTRPSSLTSTVGTDLLVSFTIDDPSFGTPTAGVMTLVTSGGIPATAEDTGTATWARVLDSSFNVIFDGSVGTSGADFIVNTTSITDGEEVTLLSGTISMVA